MVTDMFSRKIAASALAVALVSIATTASAQGYGPRNDGYRSSNSGDNTDGYNTGRNSGRWHNGGYTNPVRDDYRSNDTYKPAETYKPARRTNRDSYGD